MRAGLCTTHIHRLFTTYLTKQRYEYFSFITKYFIPMLHPTGGAGVVRVMFVATSLPYFARLLRRHPWRVWMDNGQSLELPDM